jgi:hypothetical protein
MSDAPGEHLEPEPQAERGSPGSRDTGSDEPAGGPVDRPAGTSDEQSDSSVDAQGTIDEDMPQMPSGDQGG